MNPTELEDIGCKKIHWNPAYNGGYYEYYLPLSGDGLGVRDHRLSVEINGMNGPGVMAWLKLPGYAYPLKNVKTIQAFCQMYAMLSGKSVKRRSFSGPHLTTG
jgi:hypothetical protein